METTETIVRGVLRRCMDADWACLTEFPLPDGRRADVFALDPRGRFHMIEVKSCALDFTADEKWTDYPAWCDMLHFAVSTTFPRDLLPEDHGLIVADAYGGACVREGSEHALAPARRKALTLRFARAAARRWAAAGAAAALLRRA